MAAAVAAAGEKATRDGRGEATVGMGASLPRPGPQSANGRLGLRWPGYTTAPRPHCNCHHPLPGLHSPPRLVLSSSSLSRISTRGSRVGYSTRFSLEPMVVEWSSQSSECLSRKQPLADLNWGVTLACGLPAFSGSKSSRNTMELRRIKVTNRWSRLTSCPSFACGHALTLCEL